MAEETSLGGPARTFPETLWTDILHTQTTDPARAREALSRLIKAYWKPVYYYIRQRGSPVEEAKDHTQEFFATLLEREAFNQVIPRQGRFRSWLLTCVRNFLSDQSDYRHAVKRGGRVPQLSLDDVESEYQRETAGSQPTPEEIFHRKWTLDLLREALASLDAPRRDMIQSHWNGQKVDPRRLFEARRALREALLVRVRPLVESSHDADEELRDLLADFS
jgi:RNA polymerase sigma-70 factor (ECF subfamily)